VLVHVFTLRRRSGGLAVQPTTDICPLPVPAPGPTGLDPRSARPCGLPRGRRSRTRRAAC